MPGGVGEASGDMAEKSTDAPGEGQASLPAGNGTSHESDSKPAVSTTVSPAEKLPSAAATPDMTAEMDTSSADTRLSLFSSGLSALDVHPLGNYSFGRKEVESQSQEARGVSANDIIAHRKKRFQERGMRRTVAAVLLVHDHDFPHVLLLQRSAGGGGYALPGGRLRPGEAAEDGLRRKLVSKLSPDGVDASEWDISEEGRFLFLLVPVLFGLVSQYAFTFMVRTPLTLTLDTLFRLHVSFVSPKTLCTVLKPKFPGGTQSISPGACSTRICRRTFRNLARSFVSSARSSPPLLHSRSPKTYSLLPCLCSSCTATPNSTGASSAQFLQRCQDFISTS